MDNLLVCDSCGNEQQTGKFCGKCGKPLGEKHETEGITESAATIAQGEANERADRIKTSFQKYYQYFLKMIQNPTHALHLDERWFIYGLITIILFALTYVFSLYTLANTFYKNTIGQFFGESLPVSFFDFTSPIFIYILLFLGCSFIAMFFSDKFFVGEVNYQRVIAQYGGLIVPFTALNIVAILFAFTGLVTLTLIIMSISLIFTLYFVPAIRTYDQLLKGSNSAQRVYITFGVVAVIIVLIVIIIRLVVLDFVSSLGTLF